MSTIKSSAENLTLNADGANNDIKFQSNGVEKASIDQDGNVIAAGTISSTGNTTITNGDIVFATAGKGIVLGATTNVDANTLDDYEEGTWTPAIIGSSSAGTATYVIRPGTYTKIGRIVTARTFIIWNSGNGSGGLQVSGLPFTNSNASVYGAVTVSNANGLGLTSGYYLANGYVSDNATSIVIVQQATGGGSISAVTYDAAAEMMLTAVYETA